MMIHNAWKCILRSNEHWLEREPLRFKNGVPSAQVGNLLISSQGFEVRTATTSMRQSYGIQPQLSQVQTYLLDWVLSNSEHTSDLILSQYTRVLV